MSGDRACSERRYGDWLAMNPLLDSRPDLAFRLHAEYWRNAGQGHRNAINACMRLARANGVTGPLICDRPSAARTLI